MWANRGNSPNGNSPSERLTGMSDGEGGVRNYIYMRPRRIM